MLGPCQEAAFIVIRGLSTRWHHGLLRAINRTEREALAPIKLLFELFNDDRYMGLRVMWLLKGLLG
jgi:hypothetical protein